MPAPISPIVLAGFVRMAEFALIVVVGFAIFASYGLEAEGDFWRYAGAIFAIAILSMFAFQTADIYQVQAFRGHEKQYMRLASAWSVVFLIVIGASFFAKAGEMYSRASGSAASTSSGMAALMSSRKLLFLAVRKWTREGRLTRRTVIVGGGEAGEHVIEELRTAEGFRRQGHRPVRRPRRRRAAASNAPASASSAWSTTWSNSDGARASIW